MSTQTGYRSDTWCYEARQEDYVQENVSPTHEYSREIKGKGEGRLRLYDKEKWYEAPLIAIKYSDKTVVELHEDLKEIANAIERSKYILDLGQDWDGEGANPYSFDTWIRAIEFLSRHSSGIRQEYGIILDAPKIYHGDRGEIDLLWESPKYQLLIGIPPVADTLASFYGDDYKGAVIKGTFDLRNYTSTKFLFLQAL